MGNKTQQKVAFSTINIFAVSFLPKKANLDATKAKSYIFFSFRFQGLDQF
jgi:hypothetical protein